MDILIDVVNQRLVVATNFKTLVAGTQNFVRFVFSLASEWDDLSTFAQFTQNGTSYNVYLDDENSAYLPSEIKAGTCTLMLYGSNGPTIGTTNYLTLKIDDNVLVSDAQSTEISQSLYSQLITRIDTFESNMVYSDAVQDTLISAVKTELNTYLNNGSLSAMTIVDGTISREKVDSDFESVLVLADESMQPGIYDPQGKKQDVFAYADSLLTGYNNELEALGNELQSTQTNLTDAISDISNMQANIITAEANIVTAQSSIGTIQTNIDTIHESISKLEDSHTSLSGDVTSLQADLQNEIKARSAANTTINTSISALESATSNHAKQITDLTTELNAVEDEVADARKVTDDNTYESLGDAIRGSLTLAKEYTDDSLADFESFEIKIVDELPESGEAMTFYLIANESGTRYDKYWWVVIDNEGNGRWDVFGGSSTTVVEELPEEGESDIDYILKSDDGCFYYKWIDSEWNMIAGAQVYVGDDLPETGNEFTDYYIKMDSPMPENSSRYYHYRYIGGVFAMVGSDSYTKDEVDSQLASVRTSVSNFDSRITTNEGNISALSSTLSGLQQTVEGLDTEGYTYYATYGIATLVSGEEAENVYTLYEVKDDVETVKSQFVITGGSGGGSSASTNLIIERVTSSPVVATTTDKIIIQFNYYSTDADGVEMDGTYTWKLGSSVIETGILVQGLNTFDMTDYVSTGTQKLTLTVTDEGGSTAVRTWNVRVVDVRLESSFNDKIAYTAGSTVNFTYTPYGAIEKTVHFKLDGVELASVVTSVSGTMQSYTLPAQEHGAHLLECYITATVNNIDIETDHVYKDIIWYDESSTTPVIGCIYRHDYYGAVSAKQYDSTLITYYVYDPSTGTPVVTRTADDEVVSTTTLSTYYDTWAYKTSDIGEHILTISCGETSITIVMDVEELGIDISPVITGLAFDFNPTGLSNNSEDRLWTDSTNSSVSMTVSDNFDWNNGGYQLDDNGDQYFCVKAGTTATINYNLFENDASLYGSQFKLVFKTTNVRSADATFLTCQSDPTVVGLQMDVHAAYLKSSINTLYSPYCEDDIIEYEFNINTLDTETADTALIMSYEDGVGFRPMLYDTTHRLYQYSPVPITIGSEDCDVHIYRMKAYNRSLSDSDILSNFIADARNADEMINRYNRNQIYDENSKLTPEVLAERRPDLRIIMISAPWFTNDKGDKVDDTTIRMIYKNGDPILDNWTCTGARHSGQGTSSNEYGYAGRNMDLIMNRSSSLFTLGDGVTTSKTITLTRDSVPTNYLNVKVNIASSENQNNAQMARRYNAYNPFVRAAKYNDSRVKDCMEFYNCVIFVKESNEDISTHREFLDTEYHFYAIGNVGDSKKTDSTRVNDASDPKECIIEIKDYDAALAEFPTGNGSNVCDPENWCEGNTAYDYLYADYEYEDGEFSTFGAGSYEFRYEMDGITDEQREDNINAWREMYRFVVTSTDEEFYKRLKEYFVVDSALYYYLFTERYTMVDNRAKNSFWHYGKVYITEAKAAELGDAAGGYIIDDEQAAINGGYRWDLAFGYDFDTCLGINNTGVMNLTYGKEDVDYYVDGDPTSSYVYRAAESTFFCRVRDLFGSELKAMFVDRESANAWSATSLINQWDDAQGQFPEELWRLDIERKYLRTYQGISIDNSIQGAVNTTFLANMMNGRKKYQRRFFERNQEMYMATKYFGNTATQNQIRVRCNNPEAYEDGFAPNFTFYITPYSDMYIGISFGNTKTVSVRAKAGVQYELKYESDTADIVLIYGASFIQAIDDLSLCYIGENDFSKASKLQRLVIGNGADGYSNSFLETLTIGNNPLLRELDVRNCPSLKGSLTLTGCGNLETLRAEGTSLAGIIFATNGKIATAYLPDTIKSLTMRNLNYLTDLQMSYDNLETLVIENSIVDAYAIIVDAQDTLQSLRATGLNWVLADTALLNTILGFNASYLAGNAYISGAVRNQELLNYEAAWPDMLITYNAENLVTQYLVTFVNANGTTLYRTYVDRGTTPTDPVEAGFINTPTMASTAQYDFTYTGWDDITSVVLQAKTITAVYDEMIRSYTVRWFSREGLSLGSTVAEYGSEVVYEGDTPTRTDEEGSYIYSVFSGWNNSTGFITGDVDVYAIWDRAQLPDVNSGKESCDMSPAEIYGISANNAASSYLEERDYFDIALGHDFSFNNVESELLAENLYLDGATAVDTGVKLFDADEESFTLAIDYQFTSTTVNNTLFSCYTENGYEGFRLRYNTAPNLHWGNVNTDVGYSGMRDMLVLRHLKGDTKLYVYCANGTTTTAFAPEISASELTRNSVTSTDASIVLGAVAYSDGFGYYGKGIIHWCKLWRGDLGDTNARKLASWCHETLRMEYTGPDKYGLSGNTSKRANISLVANNLLEGRGYSMNSTNTNAGGWDSSLMRSFCNNRLVDALPTTWRSIIKQVKVPTSVGNQSTDVQSSEDYIYIPAYADVYYNTSSALESPYNQEGEQIPWVLSDAQRVKFKGRYIPDTATYYTATTDPTSAGANTISSGDIWVSGSTVYMYVTSEEAERFGLAVAATAANGDGAWIAGSDWWTRSPHKGHTGYFWRVYPSGMINIGSANSTMGICVGFSV